MQNKRLVHLSDCHLPPQAEQELYGCNPSDSLEKVIQAIAQLQPPADAIVLSGDLVDSGSESGYQLFSKRLQPLQLPVYVLPGNHDDMPLMQSVFTDEQFSVGPSAVLGDWQLLLLNSQVVGASHGHVSSQQLKWLTSTLKAKPSKPTLVALHHTPCSPCVDTDCQLHNRAELMTVLQAHGNVKLILAGHTHHADLQHVGDICVSTAPSTFAQVAHPTEQAQLVQGDFFASHQLSGIRVGLRVFDLKSDGSFEQQLHWLQP